jgi:hypothetical protein
MIVLSQRLFQDKELKSDLIEDPILKRIAM